VRVEKKPTVWNSAMAKLANWNTALELFRGDYRVPLVPSKSAAYLAVSIELTAPALLLLGLATRAVGMVLLGMTAVIGVPLISVQFTGVATLSIHAGFRAASGKIPQ
jgi:putative oxidoreductase